MTLDESKTKQIWKQVQNYLKIIWLPLLLILILALESNLYNLWLNIIPSLYVFRRTVSSLALGALIFGPAVFMPRRAKYVYSLVVSLLVATIFVGEFLYYRYSGGFLQFSALFYAGQTNELWGTIKTLLSPDLWLFIFPPIIVIAAFF